MTRYMYDSTNLLDCPNDGSIVASYMDGIYAQSGSAWAAFSGLKVGIVISAATNAGQVLDIETGDATPDQAGAWAVMRLASGLPRATLYVNRSNRSAVESNLQAHGLNASQAALWVATLDGTQQVATGPYPVVAVQYANSAMTGGHYDKSIVYDDTWPPPFVFGGGGGSVGGDMTDDELGAMHDLIQFYVWGSVDTSAQSKSDFIFAVKNGTTIASIISGWMGNPAHAAWVAKLADADPTSGVTQAEVDVSIANAIAKLPAPLTLTQVDTQINAVISTMPAATVPTLWEVLKATFAAPPVPAPK